MLHHHRQGPLRSVVLAIFSLGLILAIPALAGSPCEPDLAGSAESAVYALRDAFEHQDLDAYGALLADDYVFRFQSQDVKAGEPGTLDRAGELRFARNLFRGGPVAHQRAAVGVQLDFLITERSPVVREGLLRWQQFTVMTHLRVTQLGGGELRVDGPIILRLRREGSETPAWRVVEWIDRSGGQEGRRACRSAADGVVAASGLVRPPSRILR